MDQSFAGGKTVGIPSFWGLNKVPDNAETWRHGSAVLDEWNGNGFMVVGTVLDGTVVPACTGLIAEQNGKKLATQYLTGGDKQAMIVLPKDVADELNKAAADYQKGLLKENPVTIGGIKWEFKRRVGATSTVCTVTPAFQDPVQ